MADSRPKSWSLAAYTVAVAAAVGGPTAAGAESRTIDQLQRYCSKSWQNAGIAQQDWPDCTQQALVELLERVSRPGLSQAMQNVESQERRELNRTVWRTIQRWRRSPRWSSYEESAGMPDAAPSPDQEDAWEVVMSAAADCLSERQQQILALTRDGWKVREIAERLNLPTARVSDEKYKAINKLRARLV